MPTKCKQPRKDTVDAYIAKTAQALAKVNVPVILWGEHAMVRHAIPTLLIRDDIVVPADKLDAAAAQLEAGGWTVSSGPLPRHDSFWQKGWDFIASISRRFIYPNSTLQNTRELLILPSTFIGLNADLTESSLNESPWFERLAENVYCPTAPYLLQTIIYPHLSYKTELNSARRLLLAWASYFYTYLEFREDSMDGCDPAAVQFWKEFVKTCER